MVAHSVSPTYGGKTTIQLINPTPVPVTLYSQEKIGKLSFLQEADTVRLVESSLDKKPTVRSVLFDYYFLGLNRNLLMLHWIVLTLIRSFPRNNFNFNVIFLLAITRTLRGRYFLFFIPL